MFIRKVRQQVQRTRSKAIPACTGGWNAKDNLADMSEQDAVILDNYFPDGTKITQRRGFTEHSTGLTGSTETLLVYSPTSGTQQLFAMNNGSAYNVSSAGAIGAAVGSGYTNDRWQYTNMGTAGGQFLFACNGADTPIQYDGTTWGSSTLTGPVVTDLIWCNLHQNRLWVGETDKLTAWYGGINSITGAFTEFPLYSIAKDGGYLMGMATWTRDGGSGADDVAVFVTSEGEAIAYSGTDPASTSTWNLIGVFKIGKPIGRRFFQKWGADAILITEDGFFSLNTLLGVDRSRAEKKSISRKINLALNSAVEQYKGNFGWEVDVYPAAKQLIFNIPISSTKSHQYVFNTETNAACRFVGMDAATWSVANDKIYFGGHDGSVYQADNGLSDNESNIQGDIFPAFSYFNLPQNVKAFKLAEVVYEGDLEIAANLYLNTDFKMSKDAVGPTAITYGDSAVWGTSLWGTDIWGGGSEIFRKWKSVTGIGRTASLRVRTSTNKTRPSVIAINYIFKTGGFLR